MARTPSGLDALEQAREQLRDAKTLSEFKSALSVVLPLDFGLSMVETGQALGVSTGWACQMRCGFIKSQGALGVTESIPSENNGKKRSRAYLTYQKEAEFLAQFAEKSGIAGILIVNEIRQALDQKLGRKTAQATTYNLLHRHGWRKLSPDKQHPKADLNAQQDFKKTPRNPAEYRA